MTTKIHTYTAFTDYNWNEEERPELQVFDDNDNKHATLIIDKRTMLELHGNSREDLRLQIEGYADIFKAAAESLQDE